jgi:hypothetical protein
METIVSEAKPLRLFNLMHGLMALVGAIFGEFIEMS